MGEHAMRVYVYVSAFGARTTTVDMHKRLVISYRVVFLAFQYNLGAFWRGITNEFGKQAGISMIILCDI